MFIVLEGTHGAGKTTVSKLLGEQHGFYNISLPPQQYECLRAYMHHEATGLSRFLFYLAGILDTSRGIREALKVQPVVCDRYIASTIAGCHVDYGLEIARLQSIVEILGDVVIQPDRVFLLRASMDERLKRLQSRLKKEPLYKVNPDEKRIAQLEKAHLSMFSPDKWSIIDTTGYSADEVVQKILNQL